MAKVSLKDIAREVGVSSASVSIVLNNKNHNNRVSKETAQRILNKAAELNYTPNLFGKGLRIGRSKTLGLVVADISNEFFGTLALHIQQFAEQKDYTVIIANTNEQSKTMDKMIKLLKSRQVDGFIITPTENSEEQITNLINDKIPFVLVDRSFPNITVNSVLINNFEISYKATQLLINSGCKNIACISYKDNHYHIMERKRGFIEATKAANLYKSRNIKAVRNSHIEQDIEDSIIDLIQSNKNIDGIFFVTNTISVFSVKTLFKYNVDFLNKTKLVCFDESEAFFLLPHKVPYVKQPIKEIAKSATSLLINQINNNNENMFKQLIISADLVS